ncbi:MAG: tetratricopeptide repeat protein [Phycisphaerae bacterium]|nr:tetratricopeptide repeat protein [Phycisphaerae bacterium]
MRSILGRWIVPLLLVTALSGCGQMNTWFLPPEQQSQQRLARAKTLLDAGDTSAALEELTRALQANPNHVPTITAVGDIHRKTGNYDQAVKNYKRACDIDPYAFRPHYNLGVTYQAMAAVADGAETVRNFLRQAVMTYIRALAIDPNSFHAKLNLGACYFQMGQHDLAEQATREALASQPDSARANNNLGIILETTNRLEEAVAAYKRSIEADPNQPDILVNLGAVYLRQEKIRSALAAFRQANRLDPNNAETCLQLGVCYFRLKQLDPAVQAFQDAIRLDPYDAGAYRGFGVICMYQYVVDNRRTDLRDKALRAWRYSLKLEPTQTDLQRLLQRYDTSSHTAGPSGKSNSEKRFSRVS